MKSWCALWLVVIAAITSCSQPGEPVDLLIENVTVYTGLSAEPLVASAAIRDGKFLAIGSLADNAYRPTQRIDGTGQFMIPGLWDAHTHVRSSEGGGLELSEFVRLGVTSVRDLGGYAERLNSTDAENGPTIYPSYFMLNGESFAGFQKVVTTKLEIEAAVDELAALGATQVKVHRALNPELLPEVVESSARHGLDVVGHIPLGLHPLDACLAGMKGVEHVGSLVEALVSVAPDGERGSSAATDYLLSDSADPIYECFVEHGVRVTPTLIVYRTIAHRRAGGDELPPEFVEFIKTMQRIVLRMHEAGVTLLAGTDTSDLKEPVDIAPGQALHEELEMLQGAGIPAREVIAMATANVAIAVGVSDLTGSIEEGKQADFVLLSADPGSDVRNIRVTNGIHLSGRRVGPSVR